MNAITVMGEYPLKKRTLPGFSEIYSRLFSFVQLLTTTNNDYQTALLQLHLLPHDLSAVTANELFNYSFIKYPRSNLFQESWRT